MLIGKLRIDQLMKCGACQNGAQIAQFQQLGGVPGPRHPIILEIPLINSLTGGIEGGNQIKRILRPVAGRESWRLALICRLFCACQPSDWFGYASIVHAENPSESDEIAGWRYSPRQAG